MPTQSSGGEVGDRATAQLINRGSRNPLPYGSKLSAQCRRTAVAQAQGEGANQQEALTGESLRLKDTRMSLKNSLMS